MMATIRPAEEKDIPSIMAVQKNCDIRQEPNVAKNGGLVKLFTESELQSDITLPGNHFLVASNPDSIVGYSATYSKANWIKEKGQPFFTSVSCTSPLDILENNYLCYRHLATLKNCNRARVALDLNQKVEEIARNEEFQCIVGEILSINVTSQRFHEHCGFRKIGEYQTSNYKWLIYAKEV